MNPGHPPSAADVSEEVSALITTLHRTEQRLEELTAGEVDTVSDRDGRTIMLRRAQEQLRNSEVAKQAAILNALPAHIALLNPQGLIISVNEAWHHFGRPQAIQGPGHKIGVNYLEVCDKARGEGASEARQVAAGIRAVLDGREKTFSLEYACHSPSEQHWFLMNVTPMAEDRLHGVVVTHSNITERRLAEESLRQSEIRYGEMFDQAAIGITLILIDGTILKVNPALCAMFGYSESELARHNFLELVHPDDQTISKQATQDLLSSDLQHPKSDFVHRYIRKDGRAMWGHATIALVRDAEGKPIYFVTMIEDITERKQTEQALRASEERFKTMIVQAPLGIALIDSQTGAICEINPRFAAIAGRSMEEMSNLDWMKITHSDDMQEDLDNMALMNAGKIKGFHMEKRYLKPDGAAVWIDMTIAPINTDNNVQPRHLCMIQDITERKLTERRITYLSRVYAMLSAINTLIVRVNDRDELFKAACRIAVEEGGFRMAMLCIVDRRTATIVPLATSGKDNVLLTSIKTLLSSNEDVSNTMVARAISEKIAIVSNDSMNDPQVLFGRQYAESGVRSVAVLPLIVMGEAEGAIALYSNETEAFHEEELKLLTELAGDIAFAIDHLDKQARVKYLAYYDVLTGLANRTLFLERVAQHMLKAAAAGHQLAIGLIDLERFKSINDSLGQSNGDALLRHVAEWLTQKTGDAGLVARIDADHFAIVLPELKTEGNLVMLVEGLVAAFLEHPFHLNDAVFRIGIKAGIALFPDDGDDPAALFMNAEAALKMAKGSGNRYLFYTQNMTESAAAKLNLENQLRRALDNEEFVLHYQPKVNLASGKITGAEALIRWNSPESGLVPPDRFIPLLEETGLIHKVGRWVLRKAIEDYLRWRAAGLSTVRIAVNVSPLQLRDINFIDEIKDVVATDPHAAAGLELEITESVIMHDVEHNIIGLQAIRALGVTIAIDDFGTGFSSLSYLATLPVDTLKIDRAFVIAMTAGSQGLSLVSTIINLAHALRLKVVAEGVETEEQSRLLRLLNCDEIQGFLFSKPVPADTFEKNFLTPLPPKED